MINIMKDILFITVKINNTKNL